MKIEVLTIAKHLLWCLCLVVLVSCQNDDQNEPTPLSQEDYATYESNLLGHMRHFGAQIRSNGSLGFDDESLKSISSSYFEGGDHTAFVDAIDNPNTEPLTGSLQEKVDALHTSISDQVDHGSFLTHLDGEFQGEFDSEELQSDEKQSLLHHIVHLRVATQFVNEHQDLFDTRSASGGRLASSDWWNSWGTCVLSILAGAAAGGVDAADNSETLEGQATGALSGAIFGANSGCVNALSLEAHDFFMGIHNNPYCGGETCNDMNIHNMYSYAHLISEGGGRYTYYEGDMPPVKPLSDFFKSDNIDNIDPSSIALTNGNEGPFVGKTTDGEYFAFTDCSGFVSYVIDMAVSDAFKEIMNNLPNATTHLTYCPSAAQFTAYDVSASSYWETVDGFSNIQAGDIIAWNIGDVANCPDRPAVDSEGDTGHVMIAAGPAKGPFQSQISGQGEYYTVEIFDSTVDAHLHDVRNGIKSGNDATGVGRGTIGLMADASNVILQSNFFPESDPWFCHPNITVLRLKSN